MLRKRLIPFLLVQDQGLVKTHRFRKPSYVGDPINTVRIFNEKEVDELVVLDIGATSFGRGPNIELLNSLSPECFMPVAYGGGIRGLDDAKRVFQTGIEKIVVRSALFEDPKIVTEMANYAGSSSVVVSVDVKESRFGGWHVYPPELKMKSQDSWEKLLRRVIELGAGEIVLNAVHRDGTMMGMDTKLISKASELVTVPLIAVGGVGSLGDIRSGLVAGADAIGAGAYFVYHGPRRAVLITYPSPHELKEIQEL